MRRNTSSHHSAPHHAPAAPSSASHRHHKALLKAKAARRRGTGQNTRARGVDRNQQLPYLPPETWHEPVERGGLDYKIIVEPPGEGFRHILTPAEVRQRLAMLPDSFLEPLEIVQFSRMTRKKQSFPCYGMQWGATLYLYPLEDDLVEHFNRPPSPDIFNECRMYGGRWKQGRGGTWRLIWSEATIKDYYLNNILIHELGHLLDDRNSNHIDRERYAEWFALEHGYKPSRPAVPARPRPVRRRHHAKHA